MLSIKYSTIKILLIIRIIVLLIDFILFLVSFVMFLYNFHKSISILGAVSIVLITFGNSVLSVNDNIFVINPYLLLHLFSNP